MARTNSLWKTINGGTAIQTISPTGYDILINGTNKYLNFNTLVGSSGYGIRDNAGVMEFKNSTGAWAAISSGGGGGSPGGVSGNIQWNNSGVFGGFGTYALGGGTDPSTATIDLFSNGIHTLQACGDFRFGYGDNRFVGASSGQIFFGQNLIFDGSSYSTCGEWHFLNNVGIPGFLNACGGGILQNFQANNLGISSLVLCGGYTILGCGTFNGAPSFATTVRDNTNCSGGTVQFIYSGTGGQFLWHTLTLSNISDVSAGIISVAQGGTGAATQIFSTTLFDHFVDAGNTSTTETDLYSDTLAAGQFATNGDKISAQYGGIFVSSVTATRQIRAKFGGTTFFDTGTLTLSLSSAWTMYVELIRVSASVVRYMVSFATEGAALAAYTAVGEITGLTLSGTNILKITGQAASTGAATNDIVAKMGTIFFEPHA